MLLHDDEGINTDVAKKRARVIVTTWLLVGIVGTFCFAMLSVVGFNAIISLQSRSTLYDCITPHGKCFERGQARQAETVKSLIESNELTELETRRIILASITCNKIEGIDTLLEAEKCVKQQLAIGEEKRDAERDQQ